MALGVVLLVGACQGPEGLTPRHDASGGVDAPQKLDGGGSQDGPGGTGGGETHPGLLTEGAQCTAGGECTSGFCADGVCCSSACDGMCMTCAAQNSVGTCVAADLGTDPRDQCADEGAASCGLDGACDGAGACRKYAPGTMCATASCNGSMMTLASRCDADGKCPAPVAQSCAPFVCGANGICQTVCSKDDECTAPNTCIATSCGKKPLGGACTADAECNSAHCAQGTCCSTECTGMCKSCGLAGTQGICSIVPTGQDPLGQCGDEGAATCGLDGTCDGAGGCRKYISGTTCTAAMCMAAMERGTARCDGAGKCVAGALRVCSPFMCGGAGTCATGCATAADCAADYSCIGGTCKKKVGGTTCATGAECSTGICENAVCCDKACPGPCQACNLAGSVGVCTMVPAGQDPLNHCPDDGANGCGNDGTCNGAGACRKYASGTVCGANTCTGTTFTQKSTCSGTGTCNAGATLPCVPFQCDTNGSCKTTCASNADCASPNVCVNGSCGKRPLGTGCAAATDCLSGFCEQGVCCGTACTGTCQSCAVAGKGGTCSPVPLGQDPLNQCADMGAPSCKTDGVCNGAGACENYAVGTTCAPESCTAGTYTQASSCNAAGACQAPASSSCNTYACDTTGICRMTCTMDAHCAAGFVCNSGVCSKKVKGAVCGAGTECQSGQCQQGVCCDSSCTGSCRSCAMAGTMGTCTMVPAGQDPASECADDGAPSCGKDGTCDGAGACRKYVSGTVCTLASCAGSTFTSDAKCNGAGVCQAGTQSSCTPYVCNGTTACFNTCSGNTQCLSPNTCNAMACGKKSVGAACTTGAECQLGFCAQGFCCATACTGTCQSCALTPGTCKVVPADQDPLNQCDPDPAGPSSCGNDGFCNGAGACRKYSNGTQCNPPVCSMSSVTPARTCDGAGVCKPAGAATNCGLYKCSGTACLTMCATTADCTSPLVCSAGACFTTLLNAGGPAVAPYVADFGFSASGTITHANVIDVSAVTNAAPAAVYQTGRVGNFTYTIPGFTANSSHRVRLHMCETFFDTTGSRTFNVSINGTMVLTAYDIRAASGAINKAIAPAFTVNANGAGQYVIQYTSVVNQSLLSGIEIQ